MIGIPTPCGSCRPEATAAFDLFLTLAEPGYDRFAQWGARLFEVPICLISLVGKAEPRLETHHGVNLCDASREVATCARKLIGDAPLVVLDTALDPRFSDVEEMGDPRPRFYAGAPLIDAAGAHLGTFCVIGPEPRERFSNEECRLLTRLASMIAEWLDKRRVERSEGEAKGFAAAVIDAVVVADAEGNITCWTEAAECMFGYSARQAIGRPLDLIFPEHRRNGSLAGLGRVTTDGREKAAGRKMEALAARRDGSEFPIEITMTAWKGEAGCELSASIRDITLRRARERRLEHLAHHDPLTGLMNRTGFREHLEACLTGGGAATLLALDLDGFKAVNDNFGHMVGDALLQAIAVRLNAMAGNCAFARIGGDEFAFVLARKADPLAARDAAEGLLHSLQEPFHVAGHTLQVGLSVGIAMAPLHTSQVDELLLRADLALFAAKKGGGRRACFFHTGMSNEQAARRAFKDELCRATEQKQWELFYQPQMRLDGRSLVGVEALLRWRHPRRGLLKPGAFLSALETHPVAYEVGSWVVDEACRQLASWRQAGRQVRRIGVNLFAAQFASGTLEQVVRAALDRHGLQPADLEIEVTETIALRPDDQTLAALNALREAGVHIAFDDFGTGFASLTTLKQLPVSRLKIDRSFVDDICTAPHSAAIVAAIVSLADRLDLEVIAEGIETEKQRTMLLNLGCWAGQGYLLGRPVSATELARSYPLAA